MNMTWFIHHLSPRCYLLALKQLSCLPLSSCHWVRTSFFNDFTYLLSLIHNIHWILNTKFKGQKGHTVKQVPPRPSPDPIAPFLGSNHWHSFSCGVLTFKNSTNTRFRSIWEETLLSTYTMEFCSFSNLLLVAEHWLRFIFIKAWTLHQVWVVDTAPESSCCLTSHLVFRFNLDQMFWLLLAFFYCWDSCSW